MRDVARAARTLAWAIALGCFALSGFASLIYQTTWLRQTMALFGAATPTVASMLSIFMAGLCAGSFAAGRWVRGRPPRTALLAYALAECAIAAGGLVALPLMQAFRLTAWWQGTADVEFRWLVTFLGLTLSLLPWTVAMGATFPLFLTAVRAAGGVSFGWLYGANVAGAMAGTLAAGYVLFEYVGFARAQSVGVGANVVAVLLALGWLMTLRDTGADAARGAAAPGRTPVPASAGLRGLLAATFLVGLVSLGYEVVWTRIYTPVLGSVVYAFSSLLATYLGATCLGTLLYRWSAGRGLDGPAGRWVGSLVIVSGLLPHLVTGLPGLSPSAALVLGLGPFCLLTGFWTPLLVERYAAGDPSLVGRSYAWNGLGCLLGPLLAGFVLIPAFGSRGALLALTALLLIPAGWMTRGRPRVAAALALALVGPGFFLVPTFEQRLGSARILHDSTATVAALGEGRGRRLTVNGIGMTALVEPTKWMVHLAGLAHGRPRKILVVCFGMGTSYRSALAWDAEVTAVELVPSVVRVFDYYHEDAGRVLADPRGRVVIDDGRHFLETTEDRFDVIVVDPPPPLSAAGSSLLNSQEFLQAVRRALRPGGLLLHWSPGGDFYADLALTGALLSVFPETAFYRAPYTPGAMYMLASLSPIRAPAGGHAVSDLPAAVRKDLEEWIPADRLAENLEVIVRRRLSREALVAWTPAMTRLTDDFPVNEYDWVRHQAHPVARLAVSWLGPPRAAARLTRALSQQAAGAPESPARGDPDLALYWLARGMLRHDVAVETLNRLMARHVSLDLLPELAEARAGLHSDSGLGPPR